MKIRFTYYLSQRLFLLLHSVQSVQVSDTTKLYSITTAKFINKKPAITAG